MKILAFYLPQYHAIPENDKWWGKGFTEWTNVKKAKPLFEGHNQPRVPLDNNYYNLLNTDTIKWQADLANKYGVYGFVFYHYWFNGHMLLEKPAELFRENSDINLKYCFSWANPSWSKTWVSRSSEILIKQEYGTKENWKEHFEYMLTFFKDERYIKINNRPLYIIYQASDIENLPDMLNYWNELSKENGFDGISFAYQNVESDKKDGMVRKYFDYDIEFQPAYTLINQVSTGKKIIYNGLKSIDNAFLKIFNRSLSQYAMHNLRKHNYTELWDKILDRKPKDEKSVPGAFCDWDNTSRVGDRGRVMVGANPKKFEEYMVKLIRKAKREYNKDMIFVTAWNEWAEGSYLEPDKKNEYTYLEAIYNALNKCGELEPKL